MKLIWIFLAFLSGALLPIQAGLNARMGKAVENPVYASLFSFVGGTIVLILYILLTRQSVAWAGLKTVPPSTWIAGALGAFYVTVIVLAFPRLGPALTFGLVVAGQMVIAIILDHFNILTAAAHSINIWRIIGVLMIVGGVIVIRKF